jgi:hypothetical protein
VAILLTGELDRPADQPGDRRDHRLGDLGLLKDSVKMGLHAVPDAIDEAEVRAYLAGLPGVAAVHDLHIWPMSTTETALTAHLVMPAGYPGDAILREIAHELEHSLPHRPCDGAGGDRRRARLHLHAAHGTGGHTWLKRSREGGCGCGHVRYRSRASRSSSTTATAGCASGRPARPRWSTPSSKASG